MNIARIKIDDFAKGYRAKTSKSIRGAVARNLLLKARKRNSLARLAA